MLSPKLNIKNEEIESLFTGAWGTTFPPLLNTKDLATLFQVPLKTIYFWVAQGRFDSAGRKRGKRHQFLRNRVIDIYFNGKDWKDEQCS